MVVVEVVVVLVVVVLVVAVVVLVVAMVVLIAMVMLRYSPQAFWTRNQGVYSFHSSWAQVHLIASSASLPPLNR